MLSRLENDVLGNAIGLEALDGALTRATDALLKRKNKRRLIIDLDSTEDPAHGKQESVAYNGHFAKSCFHPLFCFTSDGDCLAAKLRPGNVHSANGVLEFIKPIVDVIGAGSNFSGIGVTPPLPNQKSTGIAKITGSPISSDYRATTTWISWWPLT
jgi:hypothetical protein